MCVVLRLLLCAEVTYRQVDVDGHGQTRWDRQKVGQTETSRQMDGRASRQTNIDTFSQSHTRTF